jgi:DNA-binding beta-propeller fold protein YncE
MPDLGNEQLRFFDVESRSELGRIDLTGAKPQGVTLYPDDRTLFISLSGQNKILVVDVQTREILGEYAAGESPDGIGYSPLVLEH